LRWPPYPEDIVKTYRCVFKFERESAEAEFKAGDAAEAMKLAEKIALGGRVAAVEVWDETGLVRQRTLPRRKKRKIKNQESDEDACRCAVV
jgi:hypothetical protein